MPSITDPYPAFLSFKKYYKKGILSCEHGRVHPELFVHFDTPAPQEMRITYATVDEYSNVTATVVFVNAPPMKDSACFQIGYSVDKKFRKRGLATELVKKSIDELTNGLKSIGKKFYIEAIVSKSNIASQKVAAKLISGSPKEIVDEESGEPALQYILEVATYETALT